MIIPWPRVALLKSRAGAVVLLREWWMKRLSMRILSVLSLALLVGSVVIWVRSVRVSDQVAYRDDRSVMMLMTAPHGLCLQRGEVPTQRGTRVVISAANLVFPEPGWSLRSLPWGQATVTS